MKTQTPYIGWNSIDSENGRVARNTLLAAIPENFTDYNLVFFFFFCFFRNRSLSGLCWYIQLLHLKIILELVLEVQKV